MISFELYGDPKKNAEQILWQIRSQWIGKEPLTVPVFLNVGLGITIPKNFGKIKKKQAKNQIIYPIETCDIVKIVENFIALLEKTVILNRKQIYRLSMDKFYAENAKTCFQISPQIHESFDYSTERFL